MYKCNFCDSFVRNPVLTGNQTKCMKCSEIYSKYFKLWKNDPIIQKLVKWCIDEILNKQKKHNENNR